MSKAIRRGTSPNVKINVDIDLQDADTIWLTFKQAGKELFTVQKGDLHLTEDTVTCTLSQEQTLMLDASKQVDFQIRAFVGEKPVASNIMHCTVSAILKEGVIR